MLIQDAFVMSQIDENFNFILPKVNTDYIRQKPCINEKEG